MKDNIDNKSIGNRKFILELRFYPIVSMLDKKGQIAEAIENSKCFNVSHWEITNSEVLVRDHEEKNQAKNYAIVTFNRLSFISYKVDSIESFLSCFKKVYEAVKPILGEMILQRIGCRIIGTYKVKSTDFKSVLSHFKESFPSKIFLENYPTKDLSFIVRYENGTYKVGPINENDAFYNNEFDKEGTERHVGIAIDTDNYLTNEIKELNDFLIKDVYVLSLAVEKDLYSNLSEF